MSGKVYLVGAGPGDPGLLTLRGKAVLERADSIVYDFLANEALLRFARPNAERIRVPRRAKNPARRQAEINKLLISRARQGRAVVRLKGGDPFIFGRGGEEAETLVKAGIPFEIVPGVTAGSAAPAYAGIPVTHREFVSSVVFATGHEDAGKAGARVDWSRIAAGQGTLVLFMGIRNLAKIARALIKHGWSSKTPAAVIRWGTRSEQEVVSGTLGDIGRKAARIDPPAVTVIGEVVRLRERLKWFERLPLFGKRIAITRARDQAGPFCEALTELGAEVVEIPTIEIREPASWASLDDAIRRLEEFDYLVVTSANGVRNFLARLRACGRDVRGLKGLTIGAIGPVTAAELARSGINADFLPHEYRAEGLLESLAEREVRGKRFLIPRAQVARDLLPRELERRGARVEVVEAYETVVPKLASGEIERLLTPAPDVITFTSSSTVVNFVKLAGQRRVRKLLQRARVASIGPITSKTLRDLGLPVAVEAKESTVPGLVRAIAEHFNEQQ